MKSFISRAYVGLFDTARFGPLIEAACLVIVLGWMISFELGCAVAFGPEEIAPGVVLGAGVSANPIALTATANAEAEVDGVTTFCLALRAIGLGESLAVCAPFHPPPVSPTGAVFR